MGGVKEKKSKEIVKIRLNPEALYSDLPPGPQIRRLGGLDEEKFQGYYRRARSGEDLRGKQSRLRWWLVPWFLERDKDRAARKHASLIDLSYRVFVFRILLFVIIVLFIVATGVLSPYA